jgi:putative ABC transport system permease protein
MMKRSEFKPPVLADLLLYLTLPARSYECIRGDLTEEYYAMILPNLGPDLGPDLGVGRARRWYWRQVIRSIGPVLRGEIAYARPTKRKGGAMDALFRDLRFGLRMLVKTPGFTAVSLITLALGIGATTAMFSVVNGVLLRPLPYKEPDRLVLIKEKIPKISQTPLSLPAPDVLTFQRETRSFDGVAGFHEDQMDLTGLGAPVRVRASRISWNGFELLGVAPLLGRSFTPDEDQPGRLVAILSYAAWQRRFGGSPDVLRRTIELDRKQYEVVGVMPPGFAFPLRAGTGAVEVWTPMAFTEREKTSPGDNFDYGAVARIKPGFSLRQAGDDAEAVMRRIVDGYSADVRATFQVFSVLQPLPEQTLGDVRSPLLIMLAASVLVLLIAVANVANLTLSRGASRQREIAVRMALGAGGRRVAAQLLTESALLGAIGGAVGAALAASGVKALVSIVPGNIPRLDAAGPDLRALIFAMGVSVASGVLFGVAPALLASRARLSDALKEGGRSGGFGKQSRTLRSAFVVTQVALALTLLAGSGLLIRSFQRVLEVDPGFRPDHVITGLVSPPAAEYKGGEQTLNFFTDLVGRMRQIPGARYAGASTDLPLMSGWTRLFTPEGYQPPPGAGMNVIAHSAVLGDYFQAMGIPLLQGRLFTAEESAKAQPVVIISESIAKRYFGGRDPIGRRLKWGIEQSDSPWLTIVGVVSEVKQGALDKETMPHTYTPASAGPFNAMNLAVRTAVEPAGMASALQTTVWSLDRRLPVTQLKTMEQIVDESRASRRFIMILVSIFAAVALLLASVGLYGVMAYSVTQRTREIGVRMAMGAGRGDILKMVLRWGLSLTLTGIAMGTVGAFFVTRLLAGFLFGVKPSDWVTFVGVAVVLGAVALLACYIPARRATQVDPMVTLRAE